MHSHEELDTILSRAGEVLSALAEENDLHHANVEHWRWDVPAVSLSWLAADDIGRNVLARVCPGLRPEVEVESNAWSDLATSEGGDVRQWQHKRVGSFPIGADPAMLRDLLANALFVASAWKPEDLKRSELLTTASR